jgi:flavorubredoxin
MFKITENVSWVGKIDWELRKFHGEEYTANRGSSYNSYLIRDKKTVLIDTVWLPFSKEFVADLKKVIDLKTIDYIIVNHGEVDHSGALLDLMLEIPNTPIYCSKKGVESLKGHYHTDWNLNIVKTGDTLDIGEGTLTFIEAPMLHWPDTMFTYYSKDAILFSNDGFGQHYASEAMYNDKVDQAELYQEALKYYANILTPFSAQVTRKIKEILGFNLPLKMICPSHGVIWRDNPVQIVEQYLKWADSYQENQVTIIYDTMWDGTGKMAQAISKGIKSVNDDVVIKQYNVGRADMNDVISEIFKSKFILAGSPTINKGILSGMAGILEVIKGLQFKNKKAAAFGTYGWSGESPGLIKEELVKCGFEVYDETVKSLWNPNEDVIRACMDLGIKVGEACK